jgi:hypothetical protein
MVGSCSSGLRIASAGGLEGFIDLAFIDVTKVTYVRLTEKAFSWLSPSEPKKQKQREDKELGKAPTNVKKVCGHFLCGTFQLKDSKRKILICTSSPCLYEHLNLKNIKMDSALARIKTFSQGGRKTAIVAAAKVYQHYKK